VGNRSFGTISTGLVGRLVAMLPPLYLAYLLWEQVRGDWPVLANPMPDIDTALALVASAYLVLLISTYWRKPPFIVQRRDALAVGVTMVAIDAFSLIEHQPITQLDACGPAATLMLVGTILAAWSVRSLGGAFSLLPQARNVVASGPYTYLRHPMYAGGLLITLGELWLRWSPLSALLCAAAIGAQLARLHLEERLLESEFPVYRAYRTRTSALIPGVY
jgi:protein-S-isoprenylcysteine O-methyltransferase Ste14